MSKKKEGKELPGIIILTHGPLAEGLVVSCSMLYGELENVVPLGLSEGEGPESYLRRLTEAADGFSGAPLILLDVMGGTPFNTLMQYAKDHEVYALSGVNMPMLLEAAQRRDALSEDALLEAVEAAGREGSVNLTELVRDIKSRQATQG